MTLRTTRDPRDRRDDDARIRLLQRVRSEYSEMPGLRLTREQATRLWSLPGEVCDRLFSELERAGFLRRLVTARTADLISAHNTNNRGETTMRNAVAAICAVMLFSGSALAQQKADDKKKDDDRITVTGCLSVNAASRAYILTAKPDPMARTAGAITDAPTTVQYQLVGGQGLEQRVGNTVEVTGIVDPRSTATAESESEHTGTSGSQQTDKKPKVESKTETKIRAQVMRVESFKTLSPTCKPT